ncbi:MAG TPA: hypothetical protein VLV16_05445 [Gemmatimonadales bacterium]|nr:hypothetical protein [Gemmatimonadales bacterium]
MNTRPLLLLLVFSAPSAWGQQQAPERKQRPHRTGLWFEFGSGSGAVRIGCGGCEDARFASGSSGYLRVGGTVSDNVLLAVETYGFDDKAFGFVEGDSSIVANDATITLSVLWYPWRSGVFLKGGAGLASGDFTVTPDTGAALETHGVGVGMTFGLGYDWPISRKFAITVNGAVYITAIGDIKIANNFVDDVIAEMYQFSVGFTIR